MVEWSNAGSENERGEAEDRFAPRGSRGGRYFVLTPGESVDWSALLSHAGPTAWTS